MAEDHEERYRFASIQSEAAKTVQSSELQAGKTMALQDGEQLYLNQRRFCVRLQGWGTLVA